MQAKPPLSLKGKEMERIRRVFDEDSLGKKFASIASPREDAHMFRNTERHTMPCECIVELYELLWRWGHRGNEHAGFTKNFGFSIPDTIVIVKGKPYAWYFISKKDTAQSDQGGKALSYGARLGRSSVGIAPNPACCRACACACRLVVIDPFLRHRVLTAPFTVCGDV